VSRACALTLLAVALSGCATTVERLPGPAVAPDTEAQSECESERWLSLAPTRYQEPSGTSLRAKNDGLGVYRVGSDDPESIPSLDEELGPSPELERHAEAVSGHDRDRILAAALGGAGLVALGVGAALFAGSFETHNVRQSDGSLKEEHDIESGPAIGGGILIGVGFGLGIAGIIMNPTAQERARADSWRYAFVPDRDDVATVKALVRKHDERARSECAKPVR
jgi:hypothetical protein